MLNLETKVPLHLRERFKKIKRQNETNNKAKTRDEDFEFVKQDHAIG